MRGDSVSESERGISEVIGTVIIISMVVLSAMLIIAIGGMALQSLTEESEDSLAQDSVQEMGSSLDRVASSPVDSTATISFPEGSGKDIQPVDDGRVNITAETKDEFKSEVSEPLTYYDDIDLGTIVQENERGETIAYQGGGIWEGEKGNYSIISPPQFNYDGESIQFSFVNVSSIDSISEGEELTATKNTTQSTKMAAEIEEKLRPSLVHKDVDARVPATINVTIESQYSEGWERYAEEEMQTTPSEDRNFTVVSDHANDKVTFMFENMTGGNEINLTKPDDFSNDTVLYAGPAYEAQFNTAIDAENSGPEFSVNDTHTAVTGGQYTVAMYHNGEWVWNNSDTWKNDDGDVDEGDLPVTTTGDVTFDFDHDAPICVSDNVTSQSKWFESECESYIDGLDSEDTAEYETDIVGDDYTVDVGDTLSVDVKVTNDGDDPGQQDVGLYGFDRSLVDWEQDLSLDETGPNSEDTLTFTWTPDETDVGEGEIIAASEDTGDTATVTVEDPETPQFQISSYTVDNKTISEGETLNVEATVTNANDVEGTQIVYLQSEDGGILTGESVTLMDSSDSETVSLDWETRSGDAGQNIELYVKTADDSATVDDITVTPDDPSNDTFLLVNITDSPDEVNDVERVELTANVTNAGANNETQNLYLVHQDTSEVVDIVEDFDPATADNATFEWVTSRDDLGTNDLTVTSPADSDTTEIVVKGTPETNYLVDINETDGVVEQGQPFTVEATINNTQDSGSELVVLYDVHGNVADTKQVNLSVAEETTETFQWNDPQNLDPAADNEVEIRSEDDSDTESVDIASQLIIDDMDTTVNENAGGPDTLAATVTVENTGNEDLDNEPIDLYGYDGSIADTETRSVSAQSGATVDLEYDLPERTGTVTVETNYDDQEETIIVQRGGPDCSTVGYDGSGTNGDPYEISNVDELQCINDHGLDAHYELVDDIDAQGTEYWNNGKGFEPIGPEGHNYPDTYEQNAPIYQSHEPFSGEFDGNGHVIDGLYIDRPGENFVGLFGATSYTQNFHPQTGDSVSPGEGSLIERVRLQNVTVIGNQHVGGLAGQAGGTVLDSRSEGYVEGQEQLVGGLIGDGAHADIDNRLVAAGTVVGGENYDGLNGEGIGGLIGRATWNTVVSTGYAQTEVEGDKHVGGFVGSSSYRISSFEQIYSAGTADGVSRDGGAIVGTIHAEGDVFEDSVYWDKSLQQDAWGDAQGWNGWSHYQIDINDVQTEWIDNTTEEMTGTDTPQNMSNLDFEGGPWVEVPDDYPRFEWELKAEGAVTVNVVDTNEPVDPREQLNVTVEVENTNVNEDVVQQIVLQDPTGNPVDDTKVALEGTALDEPNDRTTVNLTWVPTFDDGGENILTVASEDMQTETTVNVTGDGTVDSDFEVAIEDYDDRVEVTQDLHVNGTVVNDGTEADSQYITLEDPTGALQDSTYVENLPASGPERTFNFTWETQTISEGDIVVRSYDDIESREVEVTDEAAEFEVAITDYEEEVTAGDRLNVTATVENVGEASGTTQVSLTDSNGEIQNTTDYSIAEGASAEVELTWNTTSRDATPTEEITVFTSDDSDSQDVTIRGSDSQFLVTVTDWDKKIEPFGTVNLDATVENFGEETDTQHVYLEDPTGDGVVAIEEVTDLGPGNSETVSFAWDAGQAEDYALTVRSDDDSETVITEIEDDSAGLSQGDGVINIDLSVVDIS